MCIGDTFTIAIGIRFVLALRQRLLQRFIVHFWKFHTNLIVRKFFIEPGPVLIRDMQVLLEIFFGGWPPVDTQEVDDLDEKPGLTVAGFAHRFHQLFQAGNEPVVTDAQQRPTGYVANAGRLDDDGARFSLRIAPVPIEQLLGHEAIVGRSPRHHRRHPGTLLQADRADVHGRE